jgi:hypothetical protein
VALDSLAVYEVRQLLSFPALDSRKVIGAKRKQPVRWLALTGCFLEIHHARRINPCALPEIVYLFAVVVNLVQIIGQLYRGSFQTVGLRFGFRLRQVTQLRTARQPAPAKLHRHVGAEVE